MNRRILASILIIGVISAVASGSTFALFNDTETSSGNTFTSGALDLKVDWNESYNGEVIDSQPLTDNPGPIFDISDVKPGDYGEATVSLHMYSNPGYVWLDLKETAGSENGCSEPETEVDDTCGNPGAGEGELGENIRFTIWNDDGDNIRQEDENVIFNGTGEELTDQTNGANLQEQATSVPDRVADAVNQEEEQTSEVCRNEGGVDTALTLDNSGSMFGEPLAAAQNSSKQLTDEVDQSDQVAIVSFSSNATLDQELTTNKTAVKQAIDQIQAAGGTNMADGVQIAHKELENGSNARENVSRVMVVLSDGVSASDPMPASQAAKADNIRVITVAYGESADSDVLEQMASREDDFYQTSNVSELSEVFQDVSRDVVCTPSNETGQQAPEPTVEDDRGLLIDADTEQEGVQSLDNSTTEFIGIEWRVPRSVGNEIQTDSKTYNFTFYAEQARHNTPQTEPTPPPPTDGNGTDNQTNVTFASVNFEDQDSNGSIVNVDEVNTSEGGFIAIINDQGSLVGASSFIQSGVVNSLQIGLSPEINQSQNLTAQVHQDTDDDQTLDFLTSNGTEDIPYQDNGSAVADKAFINFTNETEPATPPASVNFEDQSTNGSSVIVQDTDMADGGFVAVHNNSLLQGNAVGSVIGVSQYLTAGPKQDIEVDLFDVPGANFNQTELQENQSLIAMPHRNTNNNTIYDFVSSNGADDGPYTFNGTAVTDGGTITLMQQAANGTEFIDAVELCELGSKDSFSTSNCPAQEEQLVKFNWTGSDYQSNNQSVNADLDVLQLNQGGPIELEFTTDQNVSTSVVTTSQAVRCSFPGTDKTPEVCS